MKKITFVAIAMAVVENVLSPDKNFRLDFKLSSAGEPQYELLYKEQQVIKTSKLGLEIKNAVSLLNGFSIKKTETY